MSVRHQEVHRLDFVVVGDGNIGKTSLLLAFVEHKYEPLYTPTVFENTAKEVEIDSHRFTLNLWDTAGQEEFDSIRTLSYRHADCFLICFALDHEGSFLNMKRKWIPEVKENRPEVPIILVGTKMDTENHIISAELLKEEHPELSDFPYFETSSLKMQGVEEVFYKAVHITCKDLLDKQDIHIDSRHDSKKCSVM
eukprot:GCRY01004074.1.p1 GENE.GCRY01004074.1~~GCRY01004074.1.p1  ORF type:complete len:195 (+),score=21.52 GCRY01004074.1:191-775(+)